MKFIPSVIPSRCLGYWDIRWKCEDWLSPSLQTHWPRVPRTKPNKRHFSFQCYQLKRKEGTPKQVPPWPHTQEAELRGFELPPHKRRKQMVSGK